MDRLNSAPRDGHCLEWKVTGEDPEGLATRVVIDCFNLGCGHVTSWVVLEFAEYPVSWVIGRHLRVAMNATSPLDRRRSGRKRAGETDGRDRDRQPDPRRWDHRALPRDCCGDRNGENRRTRCRRADDAPP